MGTYGQFPVHWCWGHGHRSPARSGIHVGVGPHRPWSETFRKRFLARFRAVFPGFFRYRPLVSCTFQLLEVVGYLLGWIVGTERQRWAVFESENQWWYRNSALPQRAVLRGYALNDPNPAPELWVGCFSSGPDAFDSLRMREILETRTSAESLFLPGKKSHGLVRLGLS